MSCGAIGSGTWRGMDETKLEQLAHLPGKAESRVLGALERRGYDIRGKLSAPIARVPVAALQEQIERVNTGIQVARVFMADPETIYNWRRLDDRITTSGQPTEPQLADIHALGVCHIVNLGLHTHEKALPNEAASVSSLGMSISTSRLIFRTRPTKTSPNSAPK
jgi:hypothetical protein